MLILALRWLQEKSVYMISFGSLVVGLVRVVGLASRRTAVLRPYVPSVRFLLF